MSEDTRIEELASADLAGHAAVVRLLVEAFGDAERYDERRIRSALEPASDPFYRKFFVAYRGGEVVGAGGVKAADWASATHILYLSAVAKAARGQGIAKALIQARMAWVLANFGSGRILVSSTHKKRFIAYGFRPFSEDKADGRTLLVHEFGNPGA